MWPGWSRGRWEAKQPSPCARRKHFTGTAIYGEAGNVVALASAVRLAPREGGPGS